MGIDTLHLAGPFNFQLRRPQDGEHAAYNDTGFDRLLGQGSGEPGLKGKGSGNATDVRGGSGAGTDGFPYNRYRQDVSPVFNGGPTIDDLPYFRDPDLSGLPVEPKPVIDGLPVEPIKKEVISDVPVTPDGPDPQILLTAQLAARMLDWFNAPILSAPHGKV